ncbi:MAG: ATP-binding cassette domain-containing protein, partial [Giesbergeria sp.]
MTAPLLQTQDLLLRVGTRTLVRGMSFRLNAGEVWCLLGPNGSGKSTFLHTAVGLRQPQGG